MVVVRELNMVLVCIISGAQNPRDRVNRAWPRDKVPCSA